MKGTRMNYKGRTSKEHHTPRKRKSVVMNAQLKNTKHKYQYTAPQLKW